MRDHVVTVVDKVKQNYCRQLQMNLIPMTKTVNCLKRPKRAKAEEEAERKSHKNNVFQAEGKVDQEAEGKVDQEAEETAEG